MSLNDLTARQQRTIRAWCMYDWANSAYATSGIAAIFPVYFVALFQDALGDSASFLGITFTGSSTWSVAVAISTAIAALSSPFLGIISDRVPIKKALLWTYTAAGSVFTALVFFSAYTSQPWAWLFGMFILANIGFAGSQVFYNSFLAHLGPRILMDNISSRGFAYGYVGGGLLLVVHLVLILATRDSDFADLVTRIAIVSIGVWWFGWAVWTLRVLPEPFIDRPIRGLPVVSMISMGFRGLAATFRELKRFRVVLMFLGAYLLFNDGLQTVIALAGAFAADTLGVALAFNMATIVIIQFVAAFSAVAFARLAERISTKSALTVALVGWIVVVLFGVAMAPLPPSEHADYDFRLSYRQASMDYVIEAAPEEPASGFRFGRGNERWSLREDMALKRYDVQRLTNAMDDTDGLKYSISIQGGGMDRESVVGPGHPSVLGEGAIDWWPKIVRSALWAPLNLNVGSQWLLLGASVGLVIGGSQALARSLFAKITPQARSGEFFSFFGFMSRASSVFGPIVYVAATAVFDTRVAVTSILLIIVAGTIALHWVDVDEGVRVAEAENRRTEGLEPSGDSPQPDSDVQ